MKTSFKNLFLIIFSFILLSACVNNKTVNQSNIELLESYKLSIPEPSGLAFADGKLWVISDREKIIYQVNLKGEIENTIELNEKDFEGIAVSDSLFAVIKEVKREIILFDKSGKEVRRKSLNIDGSKNSGLEGIAYNSSNGHYFVINEKDPSLLIETDKDLNELKRKEITSVKDLSSVEYSSKENCLWLLSDEDRLLIKSSLDGVFLEEYKLDIKQPEGVAVDDENNLIYIVSDKEEKLYVFKL